jgi:hydroxymethylpyrimidine/phosphomethylpyrimidine kinase
MPSRIPVALTIGETDSGGGGGIAADLLTFASHRVFGAVAVAAVTAQNTRRLANVQPVAAELLTEQIDAVCADLRPAAFKVGLLGNARNVLAAAKALKKWKARNVVVDPVITARSGGRLLPSAALAPMKKDLFPLASLITPNLPEAEALVGFPIKDEGDRRLAAGVLADFGASAVLIKGGRAAGRVISDLFFDGRKFFEFESFRLDTNATHGVGCTLSAAIAANLARGLPVSQATKNALEYVRQSLQRGVYPGEGYGCPGHF